MRDYRLAQVVEPEPDKHRFRLAGVCAILGILLIGVAIRLEKKDFLSSSQAARHPGDPYTSMWFDPAGALGWCADGAFESRRQADAGTLAVR